VHARTARVTSTIVSPRLAAGIIMAQFAVANYSANDNREKFDVNKLRANKLTECVLKVKSLILITSARMHATPLLYSRQKNNNKCHSKAYIVRYLLRSPSKFSQKVVDRWVYSVWCLFQGVSTQKQTQNTVNNIYQRLLWELWWTSMQIFDSVVWE